LTLQRTHISSLDNTLLNTFKNENTTLFVAGYIENIRNHGELLFFDIINNGDILQIVINNNIENFDTLKHIRTNSTVKVYGTIILRDEDMINNNIATGLYELKADKVIIVSYAEALPIDNSTLNENSLLQYRNIHIRTSNYLKDVLQFKSKIMNQLRSYLISNEFVDIETPILTRSTPGGAKDFLTLSSQHEHEVFGLVQSPQLFKQVLMTSGIEKYFQIAKCFRDEELRSDRQPEFLQLDLEMSWVSMEEVMVLIEKMVLKLEEDNFQKTFREPLERISYFEAITKYGSDKPDLRFNLPLIDISNLLQNTDFGVFKSILDSGGQIKTITIPANIYSKKERKDLEKFAISNGAKGLGYFLVSEEGINSPLLKFLSEKEVEDILAISQFEEKDYENNYDNNKIVFFIADTNVEQVAQIGDALRNKFAEDLNLKDSNTRKYLWVYDFPMFEKKKDGSIASMHHPFTKPKESDLKEFKEGKRDILDITTYSYDLVLNGAEIGGGSVRIENIDLQKEVFDLLQLSEADIDSLSWFTDLFQFGVPEHAGFALGIDRFVQQLLNLESIKESIAFPKNKSSECPLTNAPSGLDSKTYSEYGFRIKKN